MKTEAEIDIEARKIKSFDGLLKKLKSFENVAIKELKTKYKIKIISKNSSDFGYNGSIEFTILKENKEKCFFNVIYATAEREKLYFSPRKK